MIRVVDKKDGSRKRISPIWIMPKYRNKGYGQQAILAAEKIYGSDHWCLDTILQEEGNLHLYEKLGYYQTGRVIRLMIGWILYSMKKMRTGRWIIR